MEDRALEYIQTVLEEGSVTRAAKRLFLAQPSLSQYLGRVEKNLGAEIFERNTSPVRLTAAGEIFVRSEQEIRGIRRRRESEINDIFGLKTGRLTIGSSHYRSMYLLTAVLPVFKQRYPGIRISLQEGTTGTLEEYAARGTTDFSIALLPLTYPELMYRRLFQEEIVLPLPPSHPLCGRAEAGSGRYPVLDFSLLGKEPFIVMKKGQRIRSTFFDLCRDTGVHPEIVLETESMAAAQALAAAGVGTTLIPDILAESGRFDVSPHYFSVKGREMKRTVAAAYSRERPLSAAAEAFLRVTDEVLEASPLYRAGWEENGIG